MIFENRRAQWRDMARDTSFEIHLRCPSVFSGKLVIATTVLQSSRIVWSESRGCAIDSDGPASAEYMETRTEIEALV